MIFERTRYACNSNACVMLVAVTAVGAEDGTVDLLQLLYRLHQLWLRQWIRESVLSQRQTTVQTEVLNQYLYCISPLFKNWCLILSFSFQAQK